MEFETFPPHMYALFPALLNPRGGVGETHTFRDMPDEVFVLFREAKSGANSGLCGVVISLSRGEVVGLQAVRREPRTRRYVFTVTEHVPNQAEPRVR